MTGPRYSKFTLQTTDGQEFDSAFEEKAALTIGTEWVTIRGHADYEVHIPRTQVQLIRVDGASILPCGAVFEPHHPDDNYDTERHTAWPCTRDSGHTGLHRDANGDTWTPWP